MKQPARKQPARKQRLALALAHRHAQAPAIRRGLLLPAVVFVIVVVAGIMASVVGLQVQAGAAVSQDMLAARALAAARSGTEWGAWMVRDPLATQAPGASTLPPCFASPSSLALPTPLNGMTVQVSCVRYPATGALDEGGLLLAVYQVVATASSGVVGDVSRVERRVQLRIESCKNPAGQAPTYSC